mmetsp:Transcript_5326/g.10953  ORF Transcript_5326/g.10953 Transcript_5326/m.10953 type:complete len:143 (-) Transcript_5326:58-486(-)
MASFNSPGSGDGESKFGIDTELRSFVEQENQKAAIQVRGLWRDQTTEWTSDMLRNPVLSALLSSVSVTSVALTLSRRCPHYCRLVFLLGCSTMNDHRTSRPLRNSRSCVGTSALESRGRGFRDMKRTVSATVPPDISTLVSS